MRYSFVSLVFLMLMDLIGGRAQSQTIYYVYDGATLQVLGESAANTHYAHWQIWLYEQPAHVVHYTSSLPYSHWGLIEGASAESVKQQLEVFRGFEQAYLNFFGPGSWGRYTYYYAVGPIAITDQAFEKGSFAPISHADLNYRLMALVNTVQPSLENNVNEGPNFPVREYLDQIRDLLNQTARLYSQVNNIRPQPHLIDGEILSIRTAVAQAEKDVPKLTSILPSVRLPTSGAWMSHTEWAGSDGTTQVAISETGSGVAVEQSWTGGDGSMAGTFVLTIIPYKDVGSVQLQPPMRDDDDRWTVRLQSVGNRFTEVLTSPERKTATKTLRAVNYTSTNTSVYLAFFNSTDAKDAYSYFLYHKQLGR
jgi:hypothetical protein